MLDFSKANFVRAFRVGDAPTADDGVIRQERMYETGAPLFGVIAPAMTARGWSVFPQLRDVSRRPAVIDGKTFSWKFLQNRPLDSAELDNLVGQARGENVAVALRAGQCALDIDVTDLAAVDTITDIADRIFGKTKFRRLGSDPKILYVYRVEGALKKKSFKLSGDIGAIEILAEGSAFTAYGRHYKTGLYFSWLESEPMHHGIDEAPVIDQARIELFLEEVEKVLKFEKPARPNVAVVSYVAATGLVTPAAPVLEAPLADGRESYVRDRALAYARSNPGRSVTDLLPGLVAEIQGSIEQTGRWGTGLIREVESRLRSAVDGVSSGRIRARTLYRGEDGTFSEPIPDVVSDSDASGAVDALLRAPALRTPIRILSSTKRDERKFESRFLNPNRESVTIPVAQKVEAAIREFVDAVYEATRHPTIENKAKLEKVRLLVAPTGAGKTSTLLRILAEKIQTDGPLGKPLVMLMPSYNLIYETRDKISDTLGVLVYEGKGRLCGLDGNPVKILQGAGIGTSGLCESEDENGEKIRCALFDSCAYQNQKRLIAGADIILMATSNLDVQLPKALTDNAAAVVIDESCYRQLVSHTHFPLKTLSIGRKETFLTKIERKLGIDPTSFEKDREKLAGTVVFAANNNLCPANAIFDLYKDKAKDLVQSAITLCARAGESHKLVNPGLTLEGVQKIAKLPRAQYLNPELRFWRIIKERIEALTYDSVHRGLSEFTSIPFTKNAKGDKDARIQFQYSTPKVGTYDQIRISWRTQNSFAGLPTFLMDASASEEIVKKLWARETEVIRINASLYQRTIVVADSHYSNTSMVPAMSPPWSPQAMAAAHRQTDIKAIVAKIAGMNARGRVLVCANKPVRENFCREYSFPDNVDWMHIRATQGLDFANLHSAAILIGRQEIPPRAIDALVAAMTYDDDVPETPIDASGTGLTENGKALLPGFTPKSLRMRDGRDVKISSTGYAGRWAQIIHRQTREEEALQFLGRTRPVYREGEPPIAVIFGTEIPDGTVVDAVVHIDDLMSDARAWEAVKRRGYLDSRETFVMSADLVSQSQVDALIAKIPGSDLEANFLTVQTPVGPRLAPMWSSDAEIERRIGKIVDRASHRIPAGTRDDAKFDAIVGTNADRRHAEFQGIRQSIIRSLDDGTHRDPALVEIAPGVVVRHDVRLLLERDAVTYQAAEARLSAVEAEFADPEPEEFAADDI